MRVDHLRRQRRRVHVQVRHAVRVMRVEAVEGGAGLPRRRVARDRNGGRCVASSKLQQMMMMMRAKTRAHEYRVRAREVKTGIFLKVSGQRHSCHFRANPRAQFFPLFRITVLLLVIK